MNQTEATRPDSGVQNRPKNHECTICGDRAAGYNFSAFSCSSCKSFFRRNIAKLKTAKCHRKGSCPINVATRKYCIRCRLSKCLNAGMRPELLSGVCIQNRPISDSDYSALTPQESRQISLVRRAVSVFREETSVPIVAEATDCIYVLNLAEYYIRQTVRMCRRISEFPQRSIPEQLELIKRLFPELLTLRLGFVYDVARDGFPNAPKCQAIFVGLTLLFDEHRQSNLLTFVRNFGTRFVQELEQDSIVRDLLIVRQLFSPRQPNSTSSPEFVQYHHLLNRYLEHKYQSQILVRRKWIKLTSLLEEMTQIRLIVARLFIQADEAQLATVTNEIFRE